MKQLINIAHTSAVAYHSENWIPEQMKAAKSTYDEITDFIIPDMMRIHADERSVRANAADIAGTIIGRVERGEDITVIISIEPLMQYAVIESLRKHGIKVIKAVIKPSCLNGQIVNREFLGFLEFTEIN